jgi:hypothetical protein
MRVCERNAGVVSEAPNVSGFKWVSRWPTSLSAPSTQEPVLAKPATYSKQPLESHSPRLVFCAVLVVVFGGWPGLFRGEAVME